MGPSSALFAFSCHDTSPKKKKKVWDFLPNKLVFDTQVIDPWSLLKQRAPSTVIEYMHTLLNMLKDMWQLAQGNLKSAQFKQKDLNELNRGFCSPWLQGSVSSCEPGVIVKHLNPATDYFS